MPKLVTMDTSGNEVQVEEVEVPEVKEEVVDPVEDVTELGATDELWPDGPTGAQIEEWKNVYGDVYVTSVTPEKHIVWRTLTRFEYRRLVKALDLQSTSGTVTQSEANLNNEESIAETVILFPEYKRDQVGGYMAGIASLISQEAMEASGFVALEIRQL